MAFAIKDLRRLSDALGLPNALFLAHVRFQKAGFPLPIALGAGSSDLLNPLAAPSWRLEGICEVLRFMHYLTVRLA
jgi:hypothetical protein